MQAYNKCSSLKSGSFPSDGRLLDFQGLDVELFTGLEVGFGYWIGLVFYRITWMM
jgi:hypothetical protein